MENHSTLPSGALPLTGYPLFVACQSGRLTGYPLAAEQIAELHHPSDLNSRYGLLLLLLKSIPAMPCLKNHPPILNFGGPRPLFADEYLHFLAANNLDIPHLILIWAGATPTAESIPPVETSLPESPASTARPGTVANGGRHDDALTHAIRAAIAVLSPSGGALPRPPKLFDYLLQNSGKGNKFPDFTAKSKSLLWTADNDSKKDTDVKVIAERLRRWKD